MNIYNYEDKYLYAIIRKPQEGKTFICLEGINQSLNAIHLIVTMNTIKSNKQFFERAFNKFGDSICILNSEKSLNTNINHARSSIDVIKFIKNGIKIIIMCAHRKRFNESIIEILDLVDDSNSINKKLFIHIDEAHAYIPQHRENIYNINKYQIVERINCYSATPFKIWDETSKHNIYKNIYIVDITEQYNISASTKYFGINDTKYFLISCVKSKFNDEININPKISDYLINNYAPELLNSNVPEIKKWWYTASHTYFSLGDELEFLAFISYSLNHLITKNIISNEHFSYNFIPGFQRKLTHYAVMEIILNKLNKALVVIFNGDGSFVFLKKNNKIIKETLDILCYEPSVQIQKIINKYSNCPIFVTGFMCVGMSVTLINQNIGNFDNVLISHPQYYGDPALLYQLCANSLVLAYFVGKQHLNLMKCKIP